VSTISLITNILQALVKLISTDFFDKISNFQFISKLLIKIAITKNASLHEISNLFHF